MYAEPSEAVGPVGGLVLRGPARQLPSHPRDHDRHRSNRPVPPQRAPVPGPSFARETRRAGRNRPPLRESTPPCPCDGSTHLPTRPSTCSARLPQAGLSSPGLPCPPRAPPTTSSTTATSHPHPRGHSTGLTRPAGGPARSRRLRGRRDRRRRPPRLERRRHRLLPPRDGLRASDPLPGVAPHLAGPAHGLRRTERTRVRALRCAVPTPWDSSPGCCRSLRTSSLARDKR